ncbi:hypothetical protein [uncultured Prevotella sp.]|uniref:hypothetical protein n=1 Tax=uncultured Prevotella sp. TaxID=159272 RepID=UPI0027E34106|nr:hypothetical protein [uncultured Prevotella sp.]
MESQCPYPRRSHGPFKYIYFSLSERSGVKLAVRSQQMPYIATGDNVARRAEPNNQAIVIEAYYEGKNAENIIPS